MECDIVFNNKCLSIISNISHPIRLSGVVYIKMYDFCHVHVLLFGLYDCLSDLRCALVACLHVSSS